MARYSLDTNVLSYILRKEKSIVTRVQQALLDDHELIRCPMVYYESRRGLLKKEATRQLQALDRLVSSFLWLAFEKAIWLRAAEGWAGMHKRGRPTEDADLLIAYHAHHFSAVVVTNNIKHFETFPIQVENWLA